MRYRLRTLLIVLAVGPMVLAGIWLMLPPAEAEPLPPGYPPLHSDEIQYRPQPDFDLKANAAKPPTVQTVSPLP